MLNIHQSQKPQARTILASASIRWRKPQTSMNYVMLSFDKREYQATCSWVRRPGSATVGTRSPLRQPLVSSSLSLCLRFLWLRIMLLAVE